MTIDAVHAALEMDVLQVHGDAGAAAFALLFRRVAHRLAQNRGCRLFHDYVLRVEQVSLAILFEHGAIEKTVSVKIRELNSLEGVVERVATCLCEKIDIGPEAANRTAFRVSCLDFLTDCSLDFPHQCEPTGGQMKGSWSTDKPQTES